MPYLGNAPAEAYTSTVKNSFNGDGSTTDFTLSQPSTTNNLRVVVENVVQDPAVAYNVVNGSTLRFTSAPPVGTANIYAVHLGPAAMTAVPPAEITSATNFTDGITVDKDGGTVITADRASSDGTIIDLQKSGTTVGSIGTEYSTLNIDGGSGSSGIHFAASSLTPRDNGAYTDAGIDLGTTSYRFRNAYLSGGVYVGGTGSANKLDDVEFGSYTPTVIGTTSAGTATYSNRYGEYTKIGDTVTAWFYVSITAHSGYAGSLGIGGLPFTSKASRAATGSVMTDHLDWTGARYLTLYIGGNHTNMWMFSSTDNAGWVAQGPRNESYSIYGTLTYKTN